jgi:hypothetical protein
MMTLEASIRQSGEKEKEVMSDRGKDDGDEATRDLASGWDFGPPWCGGEEEKRSSFQSDSLIIFHLLFFIDC